MMRYKSFRIRNFKGIEDSTIDLTTIGGASVFAFVGLNESGKTTLLEAVHSFSPDPATSELVEAGVPINERVPRHLISIFTGDVSVMATLSITENDKKEIASRIFERLEVVVDIANFPDELIFERLQRFSRGDLQKRLLLLKSKISVKGKSQRKWRATSNKEALIIRDLIYSIVPKIAYFPTFVFDFPKSIFITERGDDVNQFYRHVFQDILDYDGRGHTIEQDIVRRVRSKDKNIPWKDFCAAWVQHEDRDKVQQVMDRASTAVTSVVFGRWNQIFHEDTKGKEIVVSFETTDGERKDEKANTSAIYEHDVYITFQIRDGSRRFNVNDRSLGFRWFFAFMLFTQFRAARSSSSPLLFLFDEPASNLHAAAQQKLIESFPEIAKNNHMLIYTTHSHYMIEPKWLEQTFIVTNRTDAPVNSILDVASLDDESLDIKVATYRSFVNKYPSQTSYFQPILDRLEIVPSRFDIQRASIILEGKSDYFILRYAAKLIGEMDLPLLPGQGAGTFGALIALHIGWNLNFLFVLDGDQQGRQERDRYIKESGVRPNKILTIDEIVKDISVIEDLLDEPALKFISKELRLQGSPNKGQIRRFFQERLASDNVSSLSTGFSSAAAAMLNGLRKRLESA